MDTAYAIYALIFIMLMVGSLAARRLPIAQYLKMILAWIVIFAVAIVIMSFRPEMKTAWTRIKSEFGGAPGQSIAGSTIRLTRQEDGHFWIRATINGKRLDLMVDSGATFTALNRENALAAGIDLTASGQRVALETANGTIFAQRARVDTLMVGDVRINDVGIVVAENFGDVNVVGMNFLDRFSSWNATGDVLTLTP